MGCVKGEIMDLSQFERIVLLSILQSNSEERDKYLFENIITSEGNADWNNSVRKQAKEKWGNMIEEIKELLK